MNDEYPFIAKHTPSQNLAEKYCSCLFKTQARSNRGYNPYAICQANIFNNKGLKGPGNLPCFYGRSYLENQKYATLAGYATNKGLIDPNEDVSFEELVDIIADFLDEEQRLYPESMNAVPRMSPKVSPRRSMRAL